MPILTDEQRKHFKQQDIKHEIQAACQIDDRRNNDLQPNFDVINGCTEVKVDIIDHNVNPYKAMVDGILHTWADNQHNNKWKDLSPQARFAVVKECIEGRALPLAFEIPQISFQITGITRACADQIMRQRIGAVFFAKGVRDNNCSKWRVICPTKIFNDKYLFQKWKDCMNSMKATYSFLLAEGKSDWQSARSLLPMNIEYSLQSTMNLQSLKGQFARRLISTEQYDTVAVYVILWAKLLKLWPLLASCCKPAEDLAKRNLVKEVNGLSQYMGILYTGNDEDDKLRRWPLPDLSEFEGEIHFNSGAANFSEIYGQTGFTLPSPDKWPKFETYDELTSSDRELFEEA